jgi:hypothetical protein
MTNYMTVVLLNEQRMRQVEVVVLKRKAVAKIIGGKRRREYTFTDTNPLPHICYMPHPPHSSKFCHPHNIG